jgi:hypothetical protein
MWIAQRQVLNWSRALTSIRLHGCAVMLAAAIPQPEWGRSACFCRSFRRVVRRARLAARGMFFRRAVLSLLGLFALAAVVLAAVGVYGTLPTSSARGKSGSASPSARAATT